MQKIVQVILSIIVLAVLSFKNVCIGIGNAVAFIGYCCAGYVSRMATHAWCNWLKTSGGLGT